MVNRNVVLLFWVIDVIEEAWIRILIDRIQNQIPFWCADRGGFVPNL